jgi:uncharacterized protein (DUF983 family)
MKQKFKEKCDRCGEHTYFYHGYLGSKIFCDKCAKELGLSKDGGKHVDIITR